jgi:uncharacterized membrane protein
MWVLLAGLVIFLGVHSAQIVAGPFRNAQVAASEGRWKGLYSLASLVGFVLIVAGWWLYRAEAPDVFVPPDWGRPVTLVLVLLAFILLAAAYTPPGHIKRVLQHPMLTGVALWALGHLLANGDLASLLLFGAFLAWAILDRVSVAFRPAPTIAEPTLRGDIIAIVAGVAVYLVFGLWVHPWLFGAAPFA